MEIIYIIIAILVIAAIGSFLARRWKDPEKRETIDMKIITKIYGDVAVPDIEGAIEESLKNQNMLDEVIAAVEDIFDEVCGDGTLCTDEQKDSDTGSFVLTYQIQGQPAPVVFECEHLGTFDVYFKYTDSQMTESEREKMSGQYEHTMDKDLVRSAIRKLLGKEEA